ncbi:MAG: hypothetical protein IKX10_10385 [Lachnospiraceae bacterium]|nr:hypothetical protein [Lachnospiraceae bacterium]
MRFPFQLNRSVRVRAARLLLCIGLALSVSACEGGGPGDEVWEPETAKQSTIGVPKTTAAPPTTEAATQAGTSAPETSAPDASAADPSAAASSEAVVTTTEEETTEPYNELDWIDYEVKSKLTEEMYEAATKGLGTDNTFRMANVIKKARAGEPVTILAFGGVATAGEGATKVERSFDYLLRDYWKQTFPDSELTIARDVASATDPYYALHRAAMFIGLKPDLVLIDFSSFSSTSPAVANVTVYLENLVRRFMTEETQPAVMLFYLSTEVQSEDKDPQRTIAVRYRLPMISFYDAVENGLETNVYDDRAALTTGMNTLTDEGQTILAAILERYFNNVRAAVRSNKTNTSYVLPNSSEDASRYSGSHIADNANIRPSAKAGIAKGSPVSPDYPNGWSSNAPGFEITFKITARNLGILYRAVPDPAGAEVDVFVDGNYFKTFSCADTTLAAPCDRSVELFCAGSKGQHVVTLRQKAGTAGYFFALLALLVS